MISWERRTFINRTRRRRKTATEGFVEDMTRTPHIFILSKDVFRRPGLKLITGIVKQGTTSLFSVENFQDVRRPCLIRKRQIVEAFILPLSAVAPFHVEAWAGHNGRVQEPR